MEWIKAGISTTALGAEVVTGLLLDNGIRSAEIINPEERVRHLTETARVWDYADAGLLEISSRDVLVIFYVTSDDAGEKILEDVRRDLRRLAESASRIHADGAILGKLALTVEAADDNSWLHEWKKHFKPFSIGKIAIKPQWEEYSPAPGEIVFTIEPGSAFGTGQHETTGLCISALQEFLKPGDTLLDIGCGSGILSIIGLLLGASEVVACDIDPAGAVSATKKNARLNPIDLNRLHIHAGDAMSDEPLRTEILSRKYDVVAANIVADVVIELIPLALEVLRPGGFFICSGIIDERATEVLNAVKENVFIENVFNENAVKEKNRGKKFAQVSEFSMKGWHCFVGRVSLA
ncbi:MAG: 50S ribosomal protein L11 methyltransferase [Defluviitaleaceae bacterium]|nr:50S ribosomal protein L11 methyltransferase [Defluviitaleaceae bacterium]